MLHFDYFGSSDLGAPRGARGIPRRALLCKELGFRHHDMFSIFVGSVRSASNTLKIILEICLWIDVLQQLGISEGDSMRT